MSENGLPESGLATEFAKELARKLPVGAVYQEVVSPAAKQTGQLASDIVKTIQLALALIQFLSAYQDRLRGFIDSAVRRVPELRRVSPAPQILGPIIEGIRYEPAGTPIDEMFSELLSRSVDRERAHEAHPAFRIIIKQISADEARIIYCLDGNAFDYVYTRDFDHQRTLFPGTPKIEVDDLPRTDLIYPDNVPFYFEHLNQLGLAGIFQEGNQEAIYGNEPRVQVGIRARCQYKLTILGQRFVRACTADKVARKECQT